MATPSDQSTSPGAPQPITITEANFPGPSLEDEAELSESFGLAGPFTSFMMDLVNLNLLSFLIPGPLKGVLRTQGI